MRPRLLIIAALFLFAVTLILIAVAQPVPALEKEPAPYVLKLISTDRKTETEGSATVTKVYVEFSATPVSKSATGDGGEWWAYIYEEKDTNKGIEQPALVKKIKLSQEVKKQTELSVMLAVDTSGSMIEGGRMDQAKKASHAFFRKLPGKAAAGMLLFDHLVHSKEKLSKDEHRTAIKALIDQAKPGGGTAYLDACLEAIKELRNEKDSSKAIVLVTDGIDLNSKAKLADVIQQAKNSQVKVFTVGIGEAGKQQNITSVLALDKSLSMLSPVDVAQGGASKLEGLKVAARQFVDIMPQSNKHQIRSTVVKFSTSVLMPNPAVFPKGFTENKDLLSKEIASLEADGETAVFDATYDAIALLESDPTPGKKVVVALTDGIDNSSRRRVEEVIDRAKKANIALFMLGFGKKGELDETVMKRMADETGGKFYLASNPKDLIQVFENLSVKIHDDGIDEESLTQLANQTEGKYYPAKDVDKLEFILESVVVESLKKESITVNFPSRFQGDLLNRKIDVSLVRLSEKGDPTEKGGVTGTTLGKGILLAQMSPIVYLALLITLGALLFVPAGLKKMSGTSKK